MNTLTNSANMLGSQLTEVLIGIISFLPNIIMAIIWVVIGFVLGGILGRAAAHLVNLMKIDSALKAAGLNQMLNGVNFSIGKFVGGLIKWTIVVAFLMAAAQQVNLNAFAGMFWQMVAYIPNVIIAAVLLIVSFLLADFVAKLVAHSAQAAGVKGNAASIISRYTIVVVGVVAALSQLGIATSTINILFMGIVASVSLALGLAFGLGGKEVAARTLEKMENSFE
jgi:cytochrome c oxidase subunit IV